MFQDYEISFSEKKNFPLLNALSSQSPVIAMRFDSKGVNSPLHVIREGGLSLFGSHGKGPELGCLIAIREYQSGP